MYFKLNLIFFLCRLQEIQKLKEGEDKLKKDLSDSENKIIQYKKVLVKGQNKIKDQQSQLEKLGKENVELKEKSAATGPFKGTFISFQMFAMNLRLISCCAAIFVTITTIFTATVYLSLISILSYCYFQVFKLGKIVKNNLFWLQKKVT